MCTVVMVRVGLRGRFFNTCTQGLGSLFVGCTALGEEGLVRCLPIEA